MPRSTSNTHAQFQRPTHIDITVASREYAPTAGIKPLREAVARMYNEHHRKGKPSQYTWENVAIVPGGRAGLIRIAAVLNQAYLGFFIPDYTAYNEMLSLFRNVSRAVIFRRRGRTPTCAERLTRETCSLLLFQFHYQRRIIITFTLVGPVPWIFCAC